MKLELNTVQLPLTQNQTAIWLDETLFPNSSMYHIGAYYEIKGNLEVLLFAKVLKQVIADNTVFGTAISVNTSGEPIQKFIPQLNYDLPIYDFSNKATPVLESISWMESHFQKPFDIEQPPLYDFALIKAGEGHYFWLLKIHHLLIDGWGYSAFIEKFVQEYNRALGILPKKEKILYPYKDYVESELAYYSSARFEKDKGYWLEKFDDLPEPLVVARDTEKAKEKLLPVTKHQWIIPRSLYSQIEDYANEHKVSVFHFWVGILATYFHKTTSQRTDNRLCIGLPVLNRSSRKFKNTIGLFTGISPLLIAMEEGDTFVGLVQQIKKTLRSDYRHQRFPIQELLRSVNEKTLGERNLFEVTFSYETQYLKLDLEGTKATIENQTGNVDKSPISIFLRDYWSSEPVKVDFDFLTVYFSEWEIEQMTSRLEVLIESVLSEPTQTIGQHNILPSSERALLLETFNDTSIAYPEEKTIVDLFEEQVERTPNNIAVIFEDKELTYQELNEKSNQVAHYLHQTYDTKGDDIIALQLERSEWMLIAILGVLKSGTAYLPIGTDLPTARVDYMLKDSAAKVLLTDSATLAIASQFAISVENIEAIEWGKENRLPFTVHRSPSALAYIIYTSGSTGVPKGVMVEHLSLFNLINNLEQIAFKKLGSRILKIGQVASYSFDASIQTLFSSICFGHELFIISNGLKQDGILFSQFIAENTIHVIDATPSLFNLLLQGGLRKQDNLSLVQLLIGGEALPIELLKSFYATPRLQAIQIYNVYGPTEATVNTSYYEVKSSDLNDLLTVPIGRPLPNYEVYILNTSNEIQPIGIVGELCISGIGLARGYLNNPTLTAEKFIAHPFKVGERLYKTGDLARWLPDGNIEFLGRKDHQLKIRGYRIEAGEIEQILLGHEAIQSAVVIGYIPQEGGKELVAYIVPKTGYEIPDIITLRAYLGNSLPDYMIPSHFVGLDNMPLTSSGKVNRKALPAPELNSLGTGTQYIAPRNVVEKELVKIWEAVLHQEQIGVEDNFFALGGHSLRAIRLVSLIQQQFSVGIKLNEIFAHPTIAGLASQIVDLKDLHPIVLQAIPTVEAQANYALSNAQRRLWVLDQMDDNLTAYNMPAQLRLSGDLNVLALEQAFQALFNRHEVLRTHFITIEGEGRQVIDTGFEFILAVENVLEHEAQSIADAHANRIFDLEKEVLLNIRLLKIGDDNHVLLFNMHHIISDGWSMGILVKELSTFYEKYSSGEIVEIPELSIQYKDYAAWQNNILEDEATIGELRGYWLNQLADLPTLDLPLDAARPSIKTYNGANVYHQFSKTLSDKLNAYSQAQGATLFMTLTALVNTVLYRYTNQTDIVIGTPTAGRNHPDLHEQIGFYINTLVLRNKIEPTDSFEAFLSQVKATTLAAFNHDLYPFDRLVEDLDIPRDRSRSVLFDIFLVLQNNEKEVLQMGETQIEILSTDASISKFDLNIHFNEDEKGLLISTTYNTDIFKAIRIQRMLLHLENLIQNVLVQPELPLESINILSIDEKETILNFNTSSRTLTSVETLHQLFELQVKKMPDSIAIVFGNQSFTYQELNKKSNEVAHYLIDEYDIQPNDIIGFMVERNVWILIAMLGIHKSGAAYLPLDINISSNRLEFIVKDSKAKAILVETSNFEHIKKIVNPTSIVAIDKIEQSKKYNPERYITSSIFTSESLASVLYTSGSTGVPKGVLMPQKAIVNSLYGFKKEVYECYEDRLQTALTGPHTFDASMRILMGSLVAGYTIHLISEDMKLNGEQLFDYFNKHKISITDCTPTLLNIWLNSGVNNIREMETLRHILVAGEILNAKLLIRLFQTGCLQSLRLSNLYGPSEVTGATTRQDISFKNGTIQLHTKTGIIDWLKLENIGSNKQILPRVPIGYCMPNYEVFILNKKEGLLPIGVIGEICISGLSIGKGYLNNADLTHEKFIIHPYKSGAKLYKTGDKGRWLPDGNIEFLDRIDHQLKIRGYRIEAGEIEQVLLGHEAIQSAVVIGYIPIAIGTEEGGKELVAYIVPKTGYEIPDITTLRAYLGNSLPDYMIPSHFVGLENMPLTSSGKVNRKALPAPELSSLGTGTQYIAPRNVVEKELVKIWESVLHQEQIGVEDNFFALGGHSLRAIRLVSLIQQQFSVGIKLNEIFAHPTIAGLASQIVELKDLHPIVLQPIPTVEAQANYALSNAQRRLWVLDQMDDNLTAYNMPAQLRLSGDLNVLALEQAFQALFNRHEVLRTHFITIEGEGRQVIDTDFEFTVAVENVLEDEVQSIAAAHANRVFDLSKEVLLNIRLLKIGDDDHVLLFNMHHIISDGWSMGILVKELSTFYEKYSSGEIVEIPELSIQYKDYAVWQNNILEEEATIGELRGYWLNQLVDLPTLDLPLDAARPSIKTYNGASVEYQFSKELSDKLNAYSQAQGATLFMTLTALVNTVLYRYTNQTDIVIGTPTAGRNHADLHEQIGFYINTLVLRNKIEPTDSFEAFLSQVKATTLAAFNHDLYPFDRLVEDLDIPRDMSRSAVFDVMVVLQNNEQSDLSFGEVEIGFESTESRISKFDLTINFVENESGLATSIEYNTDLFNEGRIERMLGHLDCLIQSVLTEPAQALGEYNILPERERALLLETFNDTSIAYPSEKTIVDLFEEQVERTPNNIAVIFEDKELTYQELDEKSNQVAHYLHHHYDTKGDDIIALQLERSEWMLIAILGVLKSGAAYLPIGTDLPVSRVAYMLKDSEAKALLTDSATFAIASQFAISVENIETIEWEKENCSPFTVHYLPSALAYVLYTSGSTGQPKGVMMPHESLVNLITWQTNHSATGARTLQFAPYTFDVSFQEIFATICVGETLVLLPSAIQKSIPSLPNFIAQYKINRLFLPFVALNSLSDWVFEQEEYDLLSSLDSIITAGEQLQSTVSLKALLERLPKAILKNQYGPTEAHVVSEYILPKDTGSWTSLPPIGRPIANISLWILNERFDLTSIGVAGELYIEGAGLARGYLNNPILTAEKFIPFKEGERLYKTGDLARWLPDGNIEFLGRKDHQLKIRGYRIEAGEIEQILLGHEAIQSVVVIGYVPIAIGIGTEGGKELVAYIVPKAGYEIPDITTLRAYLGNSLPDYMIPSHFVGLENMPLTSSGKVNRKALPAPELSSLGTGTEYIAPRNIVEKQLVKIWEAVLHQEEIGIADNFFALGGHSLRAIRLVSLIQQQFSVGIKLSEIFTHPTIAGLTSQIVELKDLHPIILQPIPTVETQANYALSNAQRRLWVLDQMDDNLTAYNMPTQLRLSGDLNVLALEQAFQALFNRHEVLRTHFITIEGEGRQVIDTDFVFNLEIENVVEHEVQSIADAHANRVFDLEKEILLNIRLLKIGDDDHVLLFNMHHIISDGWSMGILVKELSTFYKQHLTNDTSPISELSIQYKDYAAWQNGLLEDEATIGELRGYWLNQLVDLPTLDLPLDTARPSIKTYNGASVEHQFSKALTDKLNAYSQAQGATLFMTLTALVNTVLYRYTNQTDIVIGTPTAGRNHPDLHEQIGFYINTLVLRNKIEPTDSFEAFLSQVKATTLAAFNHDLYPFDRLVGDLDIPRDMSRSAIFDVMIVLQNNEQSDLSFGEVEIGFESTESRISKFDLTINFAENESGLVTSIEYNTDLFNEGRIERMLGHLDCLIQSVLSESTQTIGQQNILPSSERALLLETFNDTRIAYPSEKTIVDLFEEQVAKTPNNIAVIFEDKELTYQELDEKSNQIAHYLHHHYDTKGDDIIALQLERSEWMIIAILGVLKSGAAYLPIGTDLPTARVDYMLKDSAAKVLLTDSATFAIASQFAISVENIQTIEWEKENRTPFTVHRLPSDLAYIIYTSGSTGQPKGVMIEHIALVNFLWSMQQRPGLISSDVLLSITNYTFDISILEFGLPLINGAKLVLASIGQRNDSRLLQTLIKKENPTFLQATPSLWRILSNDNVEGLAATKLLCGGEAFPEQLAEKLLNKGREVWNMYGPTETTIWSSLLKVEKDKPISIGQPIGNTGLFILDNYLSILPIGVAGELYIGGAGLARGYLNNPQLTAEKFITHPFKAGERLYKTGDLARWLPDGNIEFLGRIDHQLKIRGYRIEAGEIEQILLGHEAIQSAVVIGYIPIAIGTEGGKELVAYIVPKVGYEIPDITTLRAYLGNSLPDYMIPSHFVGLENMPLTSSGKVNRKALPAPELSSLGTGTEYIAPRNMVEKELVKIWEAVLNQEEIGVEDNFFALGGHSLRAIRLVSLIQQHFAVEIKLSDIWKYPTINNLGKQILEFEVKNKFKSLDTNKEELEELWEI